ncbi:baseplate J/gp47 family protein [Pseudomonadota bacterium]|nr:baseplate J/gp47 family protein [Pseudomonadota bacterium]
MAYNRPKLIELIDRQITEIDSRLPTASARLKRSILNALARASAATAHGLYGRLEYNAKQVVPDLADDDTFEVHANWWGKPRNKATSAKLDIIVTGNGIAGQGEVLQRADGVQYEVDSETIVSGTRSLSVTALKKGVSSNAQAGESLTFINAISGIDSQASVSEVTTSGTDIESLASWKQRLRERVQKTPHGGALHDYVQWAKEVSGVTRVWPLAGLMGAGTVTVYIVRDNDVDFIPNNSELAVAQSYIDSVRPVTAQVFVAAPDNITHPLEIATRPNTTAIRDAITAELADLFLRESVVDDGAGSGTIPVSHIREAISIASGEYDHKLLAPLNDIEVNVGQISSLGAIAWSSL